MQLPSFDDFVRRTENTSTTSQTKEKEAFSLEACPTPGCGCHALKARFEGGQVCGFACANGCEFSVRRNVFTGDVMYYKLEKVLQSQNVACDSRGMKFNALGEPYTDWY
jgi:hypothetical protein